MARFYATVYGQAGTNASRVGTAWSGIEGHVCGWEAGIRVVGTVDAQGRDVFEVYLTGGSNSSATVAHIATVRKAY